MNHQADDNHGPWLLVGLTFLMVSSLLGPALGVAEPRDANRPSYELERFLPDGVERLYRRYDCPANLADPCTLWAAGDRDARYIVFHPKQDGDWRRQGVERWARAVIPENLAAGEVVLTLSPKFDPSDPDTFVVRAARGEGRVQLIERPDEVLVVWMPELGAVGGFERVTVRQVATPPPTEIKVIQVPNSPDVIMEDSAGYLWFSAWNSEIYRIDPATDLAQPMTNGTAAGTPDGLYVDSRDLVWYGAYTGSHMGGLTSNLPPNRYNMPYAPSAPAIPCEAADGNIWITDHVNNRMTEFDPLVKEWRRSVIMPGPRAWVVQCLKSYDKMDYSLWMTFYQINSLGRLDLTKSSVDRYPIPCAPAFLTFDAYGWLWTTCWNNGNVVQFDPVTFTGIEYVIPNSAQAGGISISPNGYVVFTQNTLGRVAVLNPFDREVYTYEFQPRPIFKDSVWVDRAGTIWAPAPTSQRVGKIIPMKP